jgi:hypothetical protein
MARSERTVCRVQGLMTVSLSRLAITVFPDVFGRGLNGKQSLSSGRDRYERHGYLVEEPVLTLVLEEFEEEGYEPAFELEDGMWIPQD